MKNKNKMKILAHSKESRGNELITYQFELPTYLIPELLKFKNIIENENNN